MITSARQVKPFLKWAGGKSQLIDQISSYLPSSFKTGAIKKYFEPFLGGGALYFWLANRYDFECAYLYELNPSITLCYRVIQREVKKLADELYALEVEYLSRTEKEREEFYYDKREEFNGCVRAESTGNHVRQAALLIFLNKTCFNGLYRVNSKGEFNVPFGRYKKPTICNRENLLSVSELLKKAEIVCGDFELCLEHTDSESFVYFDPPYRPISTTSDFTSYSKNTFDDSEQKRLRDVFGAIDGRGAQVMLSNSDPKNINPTDGFFDELYCGYNIKRLNATRSINCNAEKRGAINEILVMNYTE